MFSFQRQQQNDDVWRKQERWPILKKKVVRWNSLWVDPTLDLTDFKAAIKSMFKGLMQNMVTMIQYIGNFSEIKRNRWLF